MRVGTLQPAKLVTAGFWNSLGLLSLLGLAMPGFAPAGMAQTRPALAIGMTNGLPRLTVTGATGKLHLVECADSLAGSGWRVVASYLATNSTWAWVDTTAAGTNARQYRIELFTNSLPPDSLVWIPRGAFTMGSPDSEAERGTDETRHTVRLSSGFFIGKYLVTQNDYLSVMSNNPSYFTPANGYSQDRTRPVERVSWYDATNYCGQLTRLEQAAGHLPSGWAYRLPTEAEWEYACRAGTTTAFHYGSALHSGMADFDGTSEYDAVQGTVENPSGIYLGRTTAVGSYQPNPWGLYDMCGNVYGWCLDWYDNYPVGSVTDPPGPASGPGKVIRGGSWQSNGSQCRSAFRFYLDPSVAFSVIGFRVVLAPSGS
jgi:formylglycine-generating enzyme required for sulfatase activity